jgi:putative flippase GtrA
VVKFEEYNMGTNEMIFRLKKNKFFVEFFNLKTFIQLVKYGVTGLLSLFTYVFLIYILTDYFGVWKYYSITVSYIAVFWLNFLISKFWTFKEKQTNSMKKQLLYYSILFTINLGATYVIVHILTDIIGVYYLLSTIFCNCLIVGWNFILYKKLIYR